MWKKLKIIIANKLGVSVKYDGEFFGQDWFDNWEQLKGVLGALIESRGWKNVLDFGCGPAIMIDYMNDRGVNYWGCDYSREARDLYLKRFGRHPDRYVEQLSQSLTSGKDVFLAFDVFEHMSDQQIATLLEQIKSIPQLFLNISRAKSIPGHINLKLDERWIDFFQRHGYRFNGQATQDIRQRYLTLRPHGEDLWHKNMFIFERSSHG